MGQSVREQRVHADQRVHAGQAVYSKLGLAIYDLWVLGVSNRFVWRCPTGHILGLYDRHVSANHLDVGVGTGFYLDRCRFPSERPRLALMDLNPNSLERAAARNARYRPEVYRANVLEPIELRTASFDSIGISYLLHCLPGTMADKSAVFEHLVPLLNPGGVFFGATLLQGGVKRNQIARRLMRIYNEKGIFTNTDDDVEQLERLLKKYFRRAELEIVGCAALFWGKKDERELEAAHSG